LKNHDTLGGAGVSGVEEGTIRGIDNPYGPIVAKPQYTPNSKADPVPASLRNYASERPETTPTPAKSANTSTRGTPFPLGSPPPGHHDEEPTLQDFAVRSLESPSSWLGSPGGGSVKRNKNRSQGSELGGKKQRGSGEIIVLDDSE
jgi:hypothetical protein